MSEQENKPESNVETPSPITENQAAPEAAEAPTTSEGGRRARSAPERRTALCVAQESLSGAPGQSAHLETLRELAVYVDALEEELVFVRAGDDPNDDQRLLDSLGAPESAREPESAGDMVAGWISALIPHVESLRKIAGAPNFRDNAAIVLFAELLEADDYLTGEERTENAGSLARQAWRLAAILEHARPAIGGAA